MLSVVAPHVKQLEEMYFPYLGEIPKFKTLWEMQETDEKKIEFSNEKDRLLLEWIMKSNNWDFFYPVI